MEFQFTNDEEFLTMKTVQDERGYIQKTPDSYGEAYLAVQGKSVDGMEATCLEMTVGDHGYAKIIMEMAAAILATARAGIPFCVDFRCERAPEVGMPASISASFLLKPNAPNEPRDGRVLEEFGTYDPMIKVKENRVILLPDRIKHWMSQGGPTAVGEDPLKDDRASEDDGEGH